MPVDWDKLPKFIQDDLAERHLTPGHLLHMTPAVVLGEYLAWNGIIGYGTEVYKAVHAIDAAEMNVPPSKLLEAAIAAEAELDIAIRSGNLGHIGTGVQLKLADAIADTTKSK